MKKLILFVIAIQTTFLLSAQVDISQADGLFAYENGSLYSGKAISNYASGAIKSSYVIENGIYNGLVDFYYENGKHLEQGFYFKGQKDGKWMSWSENGTKTAEANYAKGEKDGKWTIWDDQGVKRYEMYYSNGKKIGTWTIWNEKGQVSKQKDY